MEISMLSNDLLNIKDLEACESNCTPSAPVGQFNLIA
jgi:hypothetical protein